MNTFQAVNIIESQDSEPEELQREAWQYLIDSGIAWSLQGWYGRRAAELIDSGIITPSGVKA